MYHGARKSSRVILKVFQNFSKGQQCFLFLEQHFLPLKNTMKVFIQCQNPLFENLLHFGKRSQNMNLIASVTTGYWGDS